MIEGGTTPAERIAFAFHRATARGLSATESRTLLDSFQYYRDTYQTDPDAAHKGVSAFLVDTTTPGFSARRVATRTLGALMPTNELTFRAMRVPRTQMLGDEGQGFKIAMNAMDYGRLTVAAAATLIASPRIACTRPTPSRLSRRSTHCR